MNKTNNIPLVRAAVLEPVILAAKTIGSPVDKLLQTVGLPTQLLDDPHMLVAELPAWQLMSAITRMEDLPDFGIKAAMELAHQDIATVKFLLQGCSNLKSLLERVVQITPYQSSVNNYVLDYKDDYVWLLQKGPRLTDDFEQVELFEIAGMIQLVQLVTGKKWRPAEIHFSFKYSRHIENAEMLNPAKIFFSQQYPGIAIPAKLLAKESHDIKSSEVSGGITEALLMPETFCRQLQMAISPYIGNCKLDQRLISDISGMSWRTLQRRLKEANTSYSNVLEQERFFKAQKLLNQTDEKLLNVAMMLGYENASSFTRAFLRWAGMTPKEYRSISMNPS
jgi:AraC-like DNA-binding protein